jgi:hypothetical protein
MVGRVPYQPPSLPGERYWQLGKDRIAGQLTCGLRAKQGNCLSFIKSVTRSASDDDQPADVWQLLEKCAQVVNECRILKCYSGLDPPRQVKTNLAINTNRRSFPNCSITLNNSSRQY